MDNARQGLEDDVRKEFKLCCWCASAFFVIAFLFASCILILKYNGILTDEAKSMMTRVVILGLVLGIYYAYRVKTDSLLFYIAVMIIVGLLWGLYEIALIFPAICCFGFTAIKAIRIYGLMRKYKIKIKPNKQAEEKR